MKRLLTLVAVSLLGLGLLGCAPGDESALTVNGDEVLTIGELEDQLEAINEDEDFLTAFEARGSGAGSLDAGFVASVLSNHALTALLEQDLADEGIEATEQDESTGTEQLAAAVGGDVDNVPEGYRETLTDLFTYAAALRTSLGGDDAALQEHLNGLLLDADVEVADRYGTWDDETAQVVVPEGPVTATTAPLAPELTG